MPASSSVGQRHLGYVEERSRGGARTPAEAADTHRATEDITASWTYLYGCLAN
ncbi:MAG TPA: hypothetical protein VF462_14335 [Micromonosporaceae bacterium]